MVDHDNILDILLRESYISQEDYDAATKYSQKQHIDPTEFLLREGLISKQLLGQAIAESYKMPFIDLAVHVPSEQFVHRIPEDIAKKDRIVMVAETDDYVQLATDLLEVKDERLKQMFDTKQIKFVYALTEDLDEILQKYQQPLATRFSEIIAEGNKVAPEILDEIFEDAINFDSSDIHFEPQSSEVVIRFRVDGVLQEAGRFNNQHYDAVLNRIKVMAHLRIDEHFSVQDGAIRYASKADRPIDLRVSIAPTLEGEKVLVRILNTEISGFNLSDIGLSSQDQIVLEASSKKPFGMILTTGPTGSGKTTSLYSVLKYIKKPEINITTIEDPVEYRVAGINQIQVNPQTNITFSEGLRSIVRQDPDVILVGEIRDHETAEIAVNAALTGHLLLSTFHANDAATAIPRLLDMDIEPFLLASTLELIIAQRLVRQICNSCRVGKEYNPTDYGRMFPGANNYFENKVVTLYEGKGCQVCHGVGFKGRTAVFELIPLSAKLRELILKRPSRDEVWKVARAGGSRSLFEDGMEKVKKGITTIPELLRVVPPPEDSDENQK